MLELATTPWTTPYAIFLVQEEHEAPSDYEGHSLRGEELRCSEGRSEEAGLGSSVGARVTGTER